MKIDDKFLEHCDFIVVLILKILVFFLSCSLFFFKLVLILISDFCELLFVLFTIVCYSMLQIFLLKLIVVLELLQRFLGFVAELGLLFTGPFNSNLQFFFKDVDAILIVTVLSGYFFFEVFQHFFLLSIKFPPLLFEAFNDQGLVLDFVHILFTLHLKSKLVAFFHFFDGNTLLLTLFFQCSKLTFQVSDLREMKFFHFTEFSLVCLSQLFFLHFGLAGKHCFIMLKTLTKLLFGFCCLVI